MSRVKALDVAACILETCAKNGEQITNLKLQKLVYYAQAWFLAFYEEPLFDERIEAWVHGPVVPSVFHRFKVNKWNPITDSLFVESAPDAVIEHIAEVIRAYGEFSATELERLTHSERPWQEARGALPPDVASNNVISCSTMEEFYSSRLDG